VDTYIGKAKLSLCTVIKHYAMKKLKLKDYRPSVGPVCLGVSRPSGTRDQFFLNEICFRHLRVCYFVAPSLTRGRVCNLLLGLARAVTLGSKSRRTQAIFYCLI
jgi:hypothetical protein